MYYSAGLAALTSYGAAGHLPRQGILWIAARALLDGAGALFALYLVVSVGLFVVGRKRRTGTPPETNCSYHARPPCG